MSHIGTFDIYKQYKFTAEYYSHATHFAIQHGCFCIFHACKFYLRNYLSQKIVDIL